MAGAVYGASYSQPVHLRQPSLSGLVSRRSLVVLLGGAGAVALAGCSGRNYGPEPSPAGSVGSVKVPDDGISLAELGFTNGPVRAWSLPRTSVVTQRVDQPNQITAQLSRPDPASVVDYLVRALPAAGVTISQSRLDGASSALIADGYGWRGSVVGAGESLTLLTLQQTSA